MKDGKTLLIAGGAFSIAASLLHLAIIVGGPDWYRFFGAGEEMALLAASGSAYPVIVTMIIAALLAVWGIYALSGAGLIRRIPFTKAALIVISAIYLFRGLAAIPIVVFGDDAYLNELKTQMTFMLVSSLICVGLGGCYALGTYFRWSKLS